MHQQQENLKFMSHFKRKIVIKKGIRPTPRSEPKKKNVEFYELRANGGSIPTRCIQVREIRTCPSQVCPFPTTVKPVYNGHSQKDHKLVFKTNYPLMQVKSIADWSHCYNKICVKRPLSKRQKIGLQKIGFQNQLSLNAGQKYCRMLQEEHSAILLTFIKLPFVIKTFVLSIFEWLFYIGFTVFSTIDINLLRSREPFSCHSWPFGSADELW